MDLIGKVLKDRYYILEELAEGGNGKLYLAKDLELSSLWVVKELSSPGRKEARHLSQVTHPSLPRMVDFLEEGDRSFLIMEYIKGETLEKKRQTQTLSYVLLLQWALLLAQVLVYLHSQKPPLIYGDLKPSNVMLSENGRIYLIDLGSVREDYGDRQAACEGTPGFAAPEQYDGYLSPRSDIYAFGKTFLCLWEKLPIVWKLAHPAFFLLLLACTRDQAAHRPPSMAWVEKSLRGLYRLRNVRLALPMAVLLAAFFAVKPGFGGKADKEREEQGEFTQEREIDQKEERREEENQEEENQEEENQEEENQEEENQEEENQEEENQEKENQEEEIQKEEQQEEREQKEERKIPGTLTQEDLYEKLSQITDVFWEENPTKRDLVNAEEKLDALLAAASDREERKILLPLLAATAELAGDLAKAGTCFEKYLEENPWEEEAYIDFGLFLVRTEEIEKSQEIWEQCELLGKTEPMEAGNPQKKTQWREEIWGDFVLKN